MQANTSRRQFLERAAGTGAAFSLAPLAFAGSLGRQPAAGLKILVLGGTGQTGPLLIRQAIAHGHEITMFNRGNRSAELFPDVECLIGDRYPEDGAGLESIANEVKAGRRWDVVIDVWPHIPRLVSETAELLKDNADRYMFVSSISVYEDSSIPDQDESAEVGAAPDADNMEFNWELFGPFKAECENRVRRIFPDRNTIYRPGLIVGPRDFSFRGGYWPVRIREGGTVLAPGDGNTPTQVIDGRDLAAFEVRCMERSIGGTFNVIGPHPRNPLTMRGLLETCRSATDSDAEFTWVPADFLASNGVGPWMQMPCWLPDGGDYAGFGSRNIDKAVAAGLTFTPLAETIRDTLRWFDSMSEATRDGVRERAGISAEKETEVLAAWNAKNAGNDSAGDAPSNETEGAG